MAERSYTGTEWTEYFWAFAGLMWIVGALFFGTLVIIGQQRVASPPNDTPASNQTNVANSPETQ